VRALRRAALQPSHLPRHGRHLSLRRSGRHRLLGDARRIRGLAAGPAMKTSDITIVFQGAFKPYIPRDGLPFAEILKRTRNTLPGARILLSAWEDSDVPEGMGVDDVVLSKDPCALAPLKLTDNKVNNINRQIVST